MVTEGEGTNDTPTALQGSSFHEHIPRRCLFTARSEQDHVILDTMGAAKASRIAKRDAITFLRRSLEPHVLLHPSVISNSRVFHGLDEFLLSYATGSHALEYPSEGVQSEPTARRKIIKTLYGDNDEVMQIAGPLMDRAESLSFDDASSSAQPPTDYPPPQARPPWFDPVSREKEARQKRAIGVAARFTSMDSKYDGLPESDLRAVLSTMTNAIKDFELDDEEARKYVHNCFTGNAKRFYDSDSRFAEAKTVPEVFQLMQSRFLPAASRAATTNMLDNLSIAKELQSKSPREALDALYKTIERSMPHVLDARSGDRNAGMFLRRAVLSETWAAHPCQQFTQDPRMTFAQFHAALTSAIVTESETGSARARAYSETQDTSYVDFDDDNALSDPVMSDSIWYGGSYAGSYPRSRGRGRGYRRGARGFRGKRGAFRQRGNTFYPRRSGFRQEYDRNCWRCGLKGHISVDCTMPDSSIRDAVRARVRDASEMPTALLEVLYALAEEFDECLERIDSSEDSYDYGEESPPVPGSTDPADKQTQPQSESGGGGEGGTDFRKPSM